jgi:hypothetical protein
VIKPRLITRSVVNLLRDQLPEHIAVGRDDLPSDDPDLPYAVVYYVSSNVGPGSLADDEDEGVVTLQVTSVGEDMWQAGWLSDMCNALITGKAAGGGYAHDLPEPQHGVQFRRKQSEVPAHSEDQPAQVHATYVIGVDAWQSE